MNRLLRVLIVEDAPDDAELLLRELKRGGYDPLWERVDTPEEMSTALARHDWEIVIADYSMPRFSAMGALALLQSRELDLPFIIVSGTIGEETAVAAMRAGAHDYIMKGKLARLCPAIERELREAEVRARRRQAEAALRESDERARRQLAQLEAIYTTAPVGLCFLDTELRYLRINKRLAEMNGLPASQHLGRTVREIVPHLADQVEPVIRRVIETGRPVLHWEIRGETAAQPGDPRTWIESWIPLKDRTDRVLGINVVVEDVTERERTERRQAVQYAVTDILAESSTPQEAAPHLLRALCEGLGCCSLGELWLVDRSANRLRWAAEWHVPALDLEAFAAASREMAFAPGTSLPGRVWISGEPEWIPDILADASFVRASAAARAGLRCACAFPIHAGEEVLGVMVFLHPEVRVPDEELFRVIREVGSKIGQFLERRRAEAERTQAQAEQQRLQIALEQEQRIVETLVQKSLGDAPPMPDLQVASRYEPAFTAERIGGDYYDFFPLARCCLGVVIGDVCGKGLTAALHAVTARNMLRAYALEDPDPENVLSRLNRALYRQTTEETMFLTLIYGILDLEAGILTYAVAGHPPPVLYDPASERSTRLEVTGGLVGGVPEMRFQKQTVPFPPGAVLALFTDGVTEAAGAADPFREDGGVSAILQESADQDVEAVANAVVERARARAGGNLRDDVAVVVIRRSQRE